MPEALVDRRPPRVVDPGHDVLDAEGLAGDPGDEDVGVVAVGDRRQRRRLLDAGLDQPVAVEADAVDGLAGEVRTEPGERLGPPVDDGHGVPAVDEGVAERRRRPARTRRPRRARARSIALAASADDASPRLRRRMVSLAKRILLGKPIATSEEGHQRLKKRVALPIFASDAISSTAYATDEILLVLVAQAGIGLGRVQRPRADLDRRRRPAGRSSSPAYRQTIHAYPSGGGAYVVSRENLGETPSLVAGASLLTDYILTVAVSVAGGVLAIQSAFEFDEQWRVPLCLLLDRRHDGRQPARAAGVGRAVRPADVPLHRHAGPADRASGSTGCTSRTSAPIPLDELSEEAQELAAGVARRSPS